MESRKFKKQVTGPIGTGDDSPSSTGVRKKSFLNTTSRMKRKQTRKEHQQGSFDEQDNDEE